MRKATFTFIFTTVMLDMLSFGIVIPVLPKLVLQFEGGDSVKAAAIYGGFGTIFAAMQFIFAPILGALSDRFGRRPVILLSIFGLGIDYVLMAMAPSIVWLFVGRTISGIFSSTFSIPNAYIADVTPPEQRAAKFGMLGAAFGLGFIVGPAFGGILGNIDARLPFWVAAGLSLANCLYGFFVLPESLSKDKQAAFHWKNANPVGALALLKKHNHVLGIAFVIFLSSIAHEVLPNVWVLYTDFRYHWDSATVGWTLAAVGLASMIVQAGLVGFAVKKVGERNALLLGLLCGVIGMTIFGGAISTWIFAAGIPFLALWGLSQASAQSLMSQQVGENEQGRLQGAIAALQGIAHMIGPGLFTTTFALSIGSYATLGIPGAAFFLSGLFLFCAMLLGFVVAKAQQKKLIDA